MGVSLWRLVGPSGPEDEQPAVLPPAVLRPAAFPDERTRSALAFTLKKSARVTAAGPAFCFGPQRPSFCAALFLVLAPPFLGRSVFTARDKKMERRGDFGGN